MNLNKLLKDHRYRIFHEISDNLHNKGSEKYRERPFDELLTTTSEATDGFHAALAGDDYSQINGFIEKIATMRLGYGFPMSDVQKAFEMYRLVLVPILMNNLQPNELRQVLGKLNICFTDTIAKFSDYFQFLQEKDLRMQAWKLEQEVALRTKELSESEAKYRVLVEDINDGYFVSQNGIIVFANKAFCDMHGFRMEELLGRPYVDFTAPGSHQEFSTLNKKVFSCEEEADQHTYYRLHKDGMLFPTEVKVKRITYGGEHATAGICRDITERVKMEQRIRAAESLAHIGQLTTSLAHEIRNPLSSIKMSIQMLLKSVSLDQTGRRTVEISAQEIARLERILEQMLDTAKPLNLELIHVSINTIIESCLEILDVNIKEKDILIHRKLSPKIQLNLLDKEKMEQVIINILVNSIEAVQVGGEVSIVTRMEGKKARSIIVEITDNGVGVPAEHLPFIFDPFFSMKSTGTGLGLANVKKIVEAHGGLVKAMNRRERFLLRLSLPAKK